MLWIISNKMMSINKDKNITHQMFQINKRKEYEKQLKYLKNKLITIKCQIEAREVSKKKINIH